MNLDEKLIQEITQKVVAAISQMEQPVASESNSSVFHTGNMTITEVGAAQEGKYPDEVVIGLAPAFGEYQHQTICGLSHSDVLREVAAGIEEEGMKVRFVRVLETSDVAFVALRAA